MALFPVSAAAAGGFRASEAPASRRLLYQGSCHYSFRKKNSSLTFHIHRRVYPGSPKSRARSIVAGTCSYAAGGRFGGRRHLLNYVWRHGLDASRSLACLNHSEFPVVLCQRDLPDGAWTERLEAAGDLPEAPYLIVWSRHGGSPLWAAALHLGGYNVLATPLSGAGSGSRRSYGSPRVARAARS
jgi:hypothetical protein